MSIETLGIINIVMSGKIGNVSAINVIHPITKDTASTIEFDDFYAMVASEVIEIVEASVRFNGDILLGWMTANQATCIYGIVEID